MRTSPRFLPVSWIGPRGPKTRLSGILPRLLGAVLVLMGMSAPTPASAQSLTTGGLVTNGAVRSQAVHGGMRYIGGDFTAVGAYTGPAMPVSSTTGDPIPGFPVLDGTVNAIVSDGAGGWVLGGDFTQVGGVARRNLARLNADGSLNAWAPNPDAPVFALSMRAGIVYVGGDFLSIAGASRSRVAAFNLGTGALTYWNPAANDMVRALEATSNGVYLGGQFTSIGNSSRNYIARVSLDDGNANASWNPRANGAVNALAADTLTNTLYFGGNFTFVGAVNKGATRNNLAAVGLQQDVLQSWNPNVNGSVNTLRMGDGSVYVGGDFTAIGNSLRNHLAEIPTQSSTPTAWNPNVDGVVNDMQVDGANLRIGGMFSLVGLKARLGVAQVDRATGLADNWAPAAIGTVHAIHGQAGRVFIAGSLQSVGGRVRNHLAAFDVASGALLDWNPDANLPVHALVATADGVYAGGAFSTIQLQGRNRLARLDLLTGAPQAWTPTVNGDVFALALSPDGSRLYAGGLFTAIGGQARRSLGAISTATGMADAWQADADNSVLALSVDGDDVFAGGLFQQLAGQPRSYVGALNATTAELAPWAPQVDNAVRAISALDNRVYLGGSFTAAGGAARSRIAALDRTSGAALAWDPNANSDVYSIVTGPGCIYVGGAFTLIGGQGRGRLASLDAVTGQASGWNPAISGAVHSVAEVDEIVHAGGQFQTALGAKTGNLASLRGDPAALCGLISLTATVQDGMEGWENTGSFTASGGVAPYHYRVTRGQLPPGMTLDPATGALTGTPTQVGDFTFNVVASDARHCRDEHEVHHHIGHPPAPMLTILSQPVDVTAGETMAPAVRVRLMGSYGRELRYTPVSLQLVGEGTLANAGPVLTDKDGIATFATLSVDRAGLKQVRALYPGAQPVTSADFNVSPAAAAQFAFGAQPAAQVAGSTLAPVTLRLSDIYGNGIPGAAVAIALDSDAPLAGADPVLTDANGDATFAALSLTRAGTHRLVLNSGAVSITSDAFAVSPAEPAVLGFSAQPAAFVAGGNTSATLRLTDTYGNAIAGALVSIAQNDGSPIAGADPVLTDANGDAFFPALSLTRAGSMQFSASSGALLITSDAFAVSPAEPAVLGFSAQPVALVAGGTTSATLRLTDTYGNGIPAALVSIALNDGSPIAGADPVLTDANGDAFFPALSLTRAGSMQFSASSGALLITSDAFAVSPAEPAVLGFSAQPVALVAGGTTSATLRLTDTYGNGIPAALVSIALNDGSPIAGADPVLTDANGDAFFPALSLTRAGSMQFSASSGALLITSDAFAVSPAEPAVMRFLSQPTSLVAGEVTSATLRVEDAYANGVPGIEVSLSLSGGGSLNGGGSMLTDANGEATFMGLSLDRAGDAQLVASSGLLSIVSGSFRIDASAPALLAFLSQPADQMAGEALVPVSLQVTDDHGNPVAGVAVALALNGEGTLRGADALITDAQGQVQFDALSLTRAGATQLAASSGALSAMSQSFTIRAAAAANLVFVEQPGNSLTGAALASAVQVRVADAYENPVADAAVSLSILDGEGSLTGGDDAFTNALGLASFASLTFDRAGQKRLAANSGLLSASSEWFEIGCPAVALTETAIPATTVGKAYQHLLQASGGAAPYRFALAAGELPAGLLLAEDGTLSGAAEAPGRTAFTLSVTDANLCSGSIEMELKVVAAPAAITDLSATAVRGPGDRDGRLAMRIGFTTPAPGSTVEVYRAPFGGFPLYDDVGGALPQKPSYPPAAPWHLTQMNTANACEDMPGCEAWSYVAFVRNELGEVSEASNQTMPRINYVLGDVSNAGFVGKGDNVVDRWDIAHLKSHYGADMAAMMASGVGYLDVGPTLDGTPETMPATDCRIDFEDLMVMALQYGPSDTLTTPNDRQFDSERGQELPGQPEQFRIVAPASVRAGQVYRVQLYSMGSPWLQGLSAHLAWDAEVSEPMVAETNGQIEDMDGVVWFPALGAVDAVLLGGREKGLDGERLIAVFTFRANRDGDPAIGLASIEARDRFNRPLQTGALGRGIQPQGPTVLMAPSPNPSNGRTSLAFSMSRAGEVDLAVYSVDGRRVRTLAKGQREAGMHTMQWNGDDENGRPAGAGVYFVRLQTPDRELRRKMVLVR